MKLSNIPTGRMIQPSSLRKGGLSGIWSELMTAGVTAYGQKTNATIAQSQAAQAQAQAQAAAATAVAAQSGTTSPFTMPAVAALIAGVVIMVVMRRR